MELFKDTHLVKLELLSNATTIDSALNYIRSKQQQQQSEQIITATTTNSDKLDNTGGRQTGLPETVKSKASLPIYLTALHI